MRCLWLSLAVGLAACNGDGVVVTREQPYAPFLEIHLRYLASIGAVQTTVLANPFLADTDDEAVRRTLTGTRVVPHLGYTVARPANDLYGYRVVVAFGTWPIGGDSYCRNTGLAPRPGSAETTEVHAVLCLGPRPLSEAAARTRRVIGPDDPRFARLASDLLTGLTLAATRGTDDLDSP